MNINDFVSIDELLAEILPLCNDTKLNHGLTKGWYVSRIQTGLEELGYDSFFSTVTEDFFNWVQDYEPKGKYQIWMPKSAFNIKEMYLFIGNDCNEIDNVIRVHWKREFNNERTAPGKYTSSRMENQGYDEFYMMDTSLGTDSVMRRGVSSNVCFGNIQNGLIMISDRFPNFPHLRIKYSGIPNADIRTKPIIPRFFRKALTDYTTYQFFRVQVAKPGGSREYNAALQLTDIELKGDRRKEGSWESAIDRVKRLDRWQRKDLSEYLSKANA